MSERSEKLLFRTAQPSDVDTVLRMIEEGRRRLKASGVDQWQDGYPNRAAVEADVARKRGLLILSDRIEAGYGAVVTDGEAAYDTPECRWTVPGPYLTIHRLCIAEAYVRQGLARAFIRHAGRTGAARGFRALRADTHPDNRRMLRLLEEEGFRYAGRCYYASLRLAFEKALEKEEAVEPDNR